MIGYLFQNLSVYSSFLFYSNKEGIATNSSYWAIVIPPMSSANLTLCLLLVLCVDMRYLLIAKTERFCYNYI